MPMVETAKQTQPYSPGLDGVLAGETALCHVDEGEGGLRYRGYAVSDLAEKATFEEVASLLLFGKLPTRKELKDFATQLATQFVLSPSVEAFLGSVPAAAHPMDVLRTAVSLLGMIDAEASDHSHKGNLRISFQLLAQITLIIATAHRLAKGKPRLEPQPDLGFAGNLLFLLTGRRG
ncbi:MAG: citrate/2-methylcitrate synthase, partial [Nitrospirota bacterium]